MCKPASINKNLSFQLKEIGFLPVLAFFSAQLFTAGWSYAYHYFNCFHIGLLSIGIPYHHFFLYGFWVIRNNMLCLFLLSAVYIFVAFIVSVWLKHLKPIWLQGAVAVIFVMILITSTFMVANYFAKRTANSIYLNEKNNDYASYPRIKVWLQSTGSENADKNKFNQALQSGSYRLLIQDSTNLFLFQSFKDNKAAKLSTVVTPLRKINYIKLLPQYKSLL